MKVQNLSSEKIELFIENRVKKNDKNYGAIKNNIYKTVGGVLYVVSNVRDKRNWDIVPQTLYSFQDDKNSKSIIVKSQDQDGNVTDISREFASFVDCNSDEQEIEK